MGTVSSNRYQLCGAVRADRAVVCTKNRGYICATKGAQHWRKTTKEGGMGKRSGREDERWRQRWRQWSRRRWVAPTLVLVGWFTSDQTAAMFQSQRFLNHDRVIYGCGKGLIGLYIPHSLLQHRVFQVSGLQNNFIVLKTDGSLASTRCDWGYYSEIRRLNVESFGAA